MYRPHQTMGLNSSLDLMAANFAKLLYEPCFDVAIRAGENPTDVQQC